jgi:hypothetical protein
VDGAQLRISRPHARRAGLLSVRTPIDRCGVESQKQNSELSSIRQLVRPYTAVYCRNKFGYRCALLLAGALVGLSR